MKKLTPKGKLFIEFIILVFTVALAFLFWDSYFIYPIKLFVVLLHETSHSMVALMTGGTVSEIKIDYELGGMCEVFGGNPYLIASAGYIGSLIFGGLLFISPKYKNFSNYLCYFLAVYFIIITILYIKVMFGIIFTLSFATLLIISPNLLPEMVYSYGLKLLGFISCSYVIVDIKEDLLVSTINGSDASILAGLTGIHHFIWGVLLLIISLIVLFYLVKFNFRKV